MLKIFISYDYIVAPSGSCVHHVKEHFNIIEQTDEVTHVRSRIYEISEFLVKILGIENFNSYFPHRVGLHQSCHGLRGLNLGKPSEIIGEEYSITKKLLNNVKGIELVHLIGKMNAAVLEELLQLLKKLFRLRWELIELKIILTIKLK